MALLNSKGANLVKMEFKVSGVNYDDIQIYDLKSEILHKYL